MGGSSRRVHVLTGTHGVHGRNGKPSERLCEHGSHRTRVERGANRARKSVVGLRLMLTRRSIPDYGRSIEMRCRRPIVRLDTVLRLRLLAIRFTTHGVVV
jgi:hypothetical protein